MKRSWVVPAQVEPQNRRVESRASHVSGRPSGSRSEEDRCSRTDVIQRRTGVDAHERPADPLAQEAMHCFHQVFHFLHRHAESGRYPCEQVRVPESRNDEQAEVGGIDGAAQITVAVVGELDHHFIEIGCVNAIERIGTDVVVVHPAQGAGTRAEVGIVGGLGAVDARGIKAAAVKAAILANLAELQALPTEELLERRYQRYRAIGLSAIKNAAVEATR